MRQVEPSKEVIKEAGDKPQHRFEWRAEGERWLHKIALFASARIHPSDGMLLTAAWKEAIVQALGLSTFLLSVLMGVAGLCDPKPTRSNIIMALAVLAMPVGLLVATM